MEPEYLLIQQVKADVEAVEQGLRCLYNPEMSYEQKMVAISYVYAQTCQIKELTDSLFSQYRRIEGYVNSYEGV